MRNKKCPGRDIYLKPQPFDKFDECLAKKCSRLYNCAGVDFKDGKCELKDEKMCTDSQLVNAPGNINIIRLGEWGFKGLDWGILTECSGYFNSLIPSANMNCQTKHRISATSFWSSTSFSNDLSYFWFWRQIPNIWKHEWMMNINPSSYMKSDLDSTQI